MQMTELFELTGWVNREVKDNEIVKKYQTLHTVLQENAQQSQAQQPFEDQKDDLVSTLNDVKITKLTREQYSFLETLNIAQNLGSEGVKNIEDVLFKNVIDIATSAAKIQEYISEISSGISKIDQIRSGLEGCIDHEAPEIEEVLMRIHFSGRADVADIVALKKWSAVLHDIGRGLTMSFDQSPESMKIIGVEKGSLIIDLAVTYGIAKIAGRIVYMALEIAEKVLNLKKLSEQIRGLKLSNDKAALELDKETEAVKSNGLAAIKSEIVASINKGSKGQGDKVAALEKAVEKLVDFIENGGEVDFVIPDDIEDAEGEETGKQGEVAEIISLREDFESVRALEAKVRLLEDQSAE